MNGIAQEARFCQGGKVCGKGTECSATDSMTASKDCFEKMMDIYSCIKGLIMENFNGCTTKPKCYFLQHSTKALSSERAKNRTA